MQPTVVSPEAWEAESSGFVRTVKQRPLVELAFEREEVAAALEDAASLIASVEASVL